MTNIKDLNRYQHSQNIMSGDTTIGFCVIDYDVMRYVDTRNLTQRTGYLIRCSLRISIPNPNPFQLPSVPVNIYSDYPVLLSQKMSVINDDNQLREIILGKYSPKTLNTAVTRSDSTEDNTGISQSSSYSSGSDQSQTNSFSVGSSGGQMSSSADFSSSISDNDSGSLSTDYSAGSDYSHQDSMSIKDWGAYAQLDLTRTQPSWIWAQEYPWNVLTYNSPLPAGEGAGINLPQYVRQRMIQNGQVLPPSQLSQLGIDFVSTAEWLVIPAPDIIPKKIRVATSLGYVQGSHTQTAFTLSSLPVDSITPPLLDLPLLGLGSLQNASISRAYAVAGFVPGKFDVEPSKQGLFQLTSNENDVLVRGQGFTGVLSTDFSAGTVSVSIFFKVYEAGTDISLVLKHWCQGNIGATLTIVVNEDDENPIIRQLNVLEGQGGAVRTEEISLRYNDFSSVDYCDFLVPGLNTVTMTVTPPVPNEPGCIYTLHALAVG